MLLATIVKLFKGASGIGAPSVLFSGGLDELVAHILNWDERLRERERRITAPFLWVAGSMEHRVEMMVQEPDLTVREENLRRTLVESARSGDLEGFLVVVGRVVSDVNMVPPAVAKRLISSVQAGLFLACSDPLHSSSEFAAESVLPMNLISLQPLCRWKRTRSWA
mmetsp:Transcript_2914/g.13640  ORF Transcript_2914/g.13640 Transcript_2914/m.13640 type:complete len:166 (-) Transcript_2914:2483-2980(-)